MTPENAGLAVTLQEHAEAAEAARTARKKATCLLLLVMVAAGITILYSIIQRRKTK